MDCMALQIACLVVAQISSPGDYDTGSYDMGSGVQLQQSPIRVESAPAMGLSIGDDPLGPNGTRGSSEAPGDSRREGGTRSTPDLRGRETSSATIGAPTADDRPSRGLGSEPRFTTPRAISGATVQASALEAAADRATDELASQAAAILEQAMSVRDAEGTARPVTLLEALSQGELATSRAETITAYWRSCRAVAAMFFAEQEVEVLSALASEFPLDRTLIEAARSAAAARLAAAELHLLEARETLAATARFNGDLLPWPSDAPLVGQYETRFETWFANAPAPPRLRRIHRELPHRWQLVEQRANAVVAFEKQLADAVTAYREQQVAVTLVLQSNDQLNIQRAQFLAEVESYNLQIAEYALSLVGANVPSSTLVSTLIPVAPPPGGSVIQDAAVAPASARQPITPMRRPAAGDLQPQRAVQPAFETRSSTIPAAANEPVSVLSGIYKR